jgi:hypothetical protein
MIKEHYGYLQDYQNYNPSVGLNQIYMDLFNFNIYQI